MVQSFFTGANGLRSQQLSIDVIANNVANIDTFGFKQSRADFKDALYGRMVNPVDNGRHMNLQHGAGVVPMQSNRIFHQGAVIATDRSLDFMIEGDGFFWAEDLDGEPLYTRSGAFGLSEEDDLAFLVTSDGHYVLDENGDRITIAGDLDLLSTAPDGSLFTLGDDGEYEWTGVRLGVFTFINPAGLEAAGGNFFRESENSGPAEPALAPRVVNRALEGSNVDYAQEISRLIRAQRAFQLASRCVNTADQMAGLANSIRQ
ncbi:MAG: flagellar hook-basal body protein [Oscillospiraceae bacterium]|nr:flagellar hook-basal body protein [Oscillospiraceae bacterium]